MEDARSWWSRLEPWKRAAAIFGALAMAPIAGLAVGIFLVSAIPAIVLVVWPLMLTPRFITGVKPPPRPLPSAPQGQMRPAAAH